MSVLGYSEALTRLEFHYRALTADDAEQYAELRLHALDTEGFYFTADKEAERARTLADWAAACMETTDQVTYGVFAGDNLIGYCAASAVDQKTVKWHSTYLHPIFRHLKIAETLYKMREHWCCIKDFEYATFTIREDNKRTREIFEGRGAKPVGKEDRRFADGSVAPILIYQKPLTP